LCTDSCIGFCTRYCCTSFCGCSFSLAFTSASLALRDSHNHKSNTIVGACRNHDSLMLLFQQHDVGSTSGIARSHSHFFFCDRGPSGLEVISCIASPSVTSVSLRIIGHRCHSRHMYHDGDNSSEIFAWAIIGYNFIPNMVCQRASLMF
jgi:hypothetical protein